MKDALYEIESMRRFAGPEFNGDANPARTTILKFWRFRERHSLAAKILEAVSAHQGQGNSQQLQSGGSPFWFFAGNREAFAGDGASWGDLMEVGWKSGVSADTSGAGSPEESFGHSVTNWFFPSNRPEIFEQMIEQLMQGFQFCWRQA